MTDNECGQQSQCSVQWQSAATADCSYTGQDKVINRPDTERDGNPPPR